MRLAILSGLAESSLAFLSACQSIPSAVGRSELQSQAAAIVGVRRQTPELVALLDLVAARWRQSSAGDKSRPELTDCLTIMRGLAEGLERSGAPLASLILAPPVELKSGLTRIEAIWPGASALVLSDRPNAERLVAVEVLARGRPDLAETVIPALLMPTQPGEIQIGAARAVAASRRLSLVAKILADWSKLTISARRELMSGLISQPWPAPALVDALEGHLIAPSELGPTARTTLEHLADAKLRDRALKMLAKFAPAQRAEALARYQAALKLIGEPKRGSVVFAKNCQTCHQHQGQGHRVGPDLSGIAGRAAEALLVDVVDPNREVAPDFTTLSVATRRGQVFAGLLAEETATTLKLRRAEGVEDTLLRTEIDELRSTATSLMPEGLEQNINLQEMADLIAFLREGR